MKEIIDCHSHIGRDMYWKNLGSLDEYQRETQKKGVTESFIMSVPSPIYIEGNKKITLLKYKHYGQEIKYFKLEEDLKTKEIKKISVRNNCNPYKRANDELYNACKNDLSLNYVPLIHPLFYSIDDFCEHIKRGARIFKIHGIACGVTPSMISEEFFKIIEYLKVFLLIHTDYSDVENICHYNDANHWLNVLSKYDIKVYFAHAVRLIQRAIDEVNCDDRYIIGLGPDKIINDASTPMAIKNGNYLEYCLNVFDINKIVFDIDYPWNIVGGNDYSLDWYSVDRVKKILSENEQEKVFCKNIKNFIRR